jgi:hypothetical protein
MNVSIAPSAATTNSSRSVATKVALGASIVGALIATSGIALLVVLRAPVELGSAMSYLCWLGSIGVLVGRRRWAPVASAALSAVILVLLANQPYATGSLLNPTGNLGHFVGVLVILTCALLVLGASVLAAARQSHPRKEGHGT